MRGPSGSSTGTGMAPSSTGGAVAAGTAGGAVGGGSNPKKKFGKNLNKLVNRPAAPPIVDRGLHGSSRNGLLLLSKAKSGGGSGGTISGTAASTSGAGAGGAVVASSSGVTTNGSNGAGPTPSSSGGLLAKSLVSSSSSSSAPSSASTHHEFLLSTAKGGVGSQQQSNALVPDAWGATTSHSSNNGAAASAPTVPTTQDNSSRSAEPMPAIAPSSREVPRQDGPAWDEYGGRGSGPTGRRLLDVTDAPSGGGGNDAQADAMSRLARDKAEQKRREEAARVQEQQAKATMRLRDLDLRRAGAHPPPQQPAAEGVHTPPPPPSLPHPRWDATRSGTKELWEPDQPLTSSRRGVDPRRARSNSGGDKSDEHSPRANPSSAAAATGPPLIHLNSFDDRDRGEPARGAGSAPRMLFDPKSGSMVAVKARDEHHPAPSNAAGMTSSSAANAKKKAAARSTAKSRGGGTGKDASRGDSPNDVTKIVRANNGPTSLATKAKKDVLAASSTTAPGDAAAKADGNATRRLPRTCGVLYQRDDKGNCYCADECDGDLGYGSHSVPGGRARNPDAYAAFLREHYRRRGADAPGGAAGGYDSQLHYDAYGGADENYDGGEGDVALYTGFNPEGEFVPPEPIEYVRADDKLELVTGVDDSPSLKPTAKEFAPSQAALAAARAAAESKKDSSLLESSDDEDDAYGNDADDDEDVDEDDGPLGLGFDPTLDMDFVMQSPSHDDDRKRVESFAISALDLEPTAFTSTEEALGPRHIFAFGTSGTWGVSHPMATTSIGGDWKVSDVGDVNALFGSGAFRVGNDDGEAKGQSAVSSTSSVASFLNIPASSSWGSPGTPLGGLANVASPGSGD